MAFSVTQELHVTTYRKTQQHKKLKCTYDLSKTLSQKWVQDQQEACGVLRVGQAREAEAEFTNGALSLSCKHFLAQET